MGVGDQIIASGLARDAWAKRGKKIAFGVPGRVIWDKHSELIFRNNPNVVFPGNHHSAPVEWVPFYKGCRGYNKQAGDHWVWNMDWKCVPGQIFLTHGEKSHGMRYGKAFVVIEPNVVWWKSSAHNKDWGVAKYQELADALVASGVRVVQFTHKDASHILKNVEQFATKDFRDAVAVLMNAAGYVGAEGGLHHAAAAVDVRGVVLFGGFIPPSVTGYDIHTNIAGSDRFCGSFSKCTHCKEAMASITVDQVYQATKESLKWSR